MGTRLNALDLAFLGLETQRTPVNVAALQLLEPPAGYQGNFVRDLLSRMSKLPAGPPFNLKLSSTNLLAAPQWIVDKNFDLDYHVRHSALPQPGTMTDLLALASRLHSRVMDRERPLWELHVIEGLEDGRFAIYMKMHHAAIDGMGGIALLESCYSEDPDEPARAPWATMPAKRGRRDSLGLVERAGKLVRGAASQAAVGADVGKLLLGHGMKTMGMRPDDSPVPFNAPKTLFNVPISGARRFCATSISLAEIKAVGKAAGATVNDMVLAICGGALRRYLLDKDALPEASLVATVPMSVRQINRTGNQITYVGAKLGTQHADPLEQLHEIGVSTAQAKQEVSDVTPEAATTFAVMAQGLVVVLNRFRLTDWVPPPANVTISNVPGPRKPLFLGGAMMQANYPLSVLVDGQALNITVMSYCDSVDFGVMACRDCVPDADVLTAHIGDAFDDLKTAISERPPAPRKRSRKGAGSASSARAKARRRKQTAAAAD